MEDKSRYLQDTSPQSSACPSLEEVLLRPEPYLAHEDIRVGAQEENLALGSCRLG